MCMYVLRIREYFISFKDVDITRGSLHWSCLFNWRGEGVKNGQNLVHVIIEWPHNQITRGTPAWLAGLFRPIQQNDKSATSQHVVYVYFLKVLQRVGHSDDFISVYSKEKRQRPGRVKLHRTGPNGWKLSCFKRNTMPHFESFDSEMQAYDLII